MSVLIVYGFVVNFIQLINIVTHTGNRKAFAMN